MIIFGFSYEDIPKGLLVDAYLSYLDSICFIELTIEAQLKFLMKI